MPDEINVIRTFFIVFALGLSLPLSACGKTDDIAGEPVKGSGGTGGTGDAESDSLFATTCATGYPGTDLVRISAPDGSYYCMDQREVTNAEYGAFLAAKNGDTSGQPKECAWNESFTPNLFDPNDDTTHNSNECPKDAWNLEQSPGHPVRCVDFCDAFAYCAWAGKRLCGEVGAQNSAVRIKSSSDFAELGSSTNSEWYNACSQGGQTKYPYGQTYVAGRCKDVARGSVTELSGNACVTEAPGYEGVFDLSGSVEEWVNFCVADTEFGPGSSCAFYGGAFQAPDETYLACGRFGGTAAFTTSVMVGFRCCADAIPAP